jgi:hypothetical protein
MSLPRGGKGAEMMLPAAAQPPRRTTVLALCINGNVDACDSQPSSPILDYAFAAAIAWPLQRVALPAACPCPRSGNATRLSPYQLDFRSVIPHRLITVFNAFRIYFPVLPSPPSPVFPTFSRHQDSTLVSPSLYPPSQILDENTKCSTHSTA